MINRILCAFGFHSWMPIFEVNPHDFIASFYCCRGGGCGATQSMFVNRIGSER